MLKKKYFLVFLLLFSVFLAQAQKNNFIIAGKIVTDVKIKKIYLSYYYNNTYYYDSCKIINKQFKLSGKIGYPIEATIGISKNFELDDSISSIIYIEPTQMQLNLHSTNAKLWILKGSNTHNDYCVLENLKTKVRNKLDSLIKLKNNITKDFFDKELEKINQEEVKLDFKFIKKYNNSFLSIDRLNFHLYKNSSTKAKEIIWLYKNLTLRLRKSFPGKNLKTNINLLVNNQVGKIAYNFQLTDLNNKKIELKNYRGRNIILLDFWASWCKPCREDNPDLIKIYNQYRKLGFEIIGISKDKDSSAWKSAIMQDSTNIWKHTIVNTTSKQINNEDVFKLYFVSSIPVKVLIDRNGKIIGRWVGGGKQNLNIIDLLIQNELTKPIF